MIDLHRLQRTEEGARLGSVLWFRLAVGNNLREHLRKIELPGRCDANSFLWDRLGVRLWRCVSKIEPESLHLLQRQLYYPGLRPLARKVGRT